MDVPIEKVLDESASGLRHLRWAREIVGTLIALAASGELLTDAQATIVRDEAAALTHVIGTLSSAVKGYRDFLERKRTLARGKVRAAEVLLLLSAMDESAPSLALSNAEAELQTAIENERLALRSALSEAIKKTRDHILSIGTRLDAEFPEAACRAVYPLLANDQTAVLDQGDNFDDSAA